MNRAYPLLLEVNTRAWLNELSGSCAQPVTLADVPAHCIRGWVELGYTHIWLMGVWDSGPLATQVARDEPDLVAFARNADGLTLGDISGSPYAVSNYCVPQQMGGMEGLASFRQMLNNAGLRLVLDFVPNHVGIDHPWLYRHPDYFMQSPCTSDALPGLLIKTSRGFVKLAHGKDPFFPPWTDTIQLDYRRSPTRLAMRELLLSLAPHCDGVRCDMAMLLLRDVFQSTWDKWPCVDADWSGEFWPGAIETVHWLHPQFEFIAEVYWGLGPRLQELGFDYTYDKDLYDHIVGRDYPGVLRHLSETPPSSISRSVHFLENHDEARIASRLSQAEQRAAAALILCLPGMRLLHQGQVEGARLRTPVQFTRWAPEPPCPATIQMYKEILQGIAGTCVGKGDACLISSGSFLAHNSKPCILLEWSVDGLFRDLIAINFSTEAACCVLPKAYCGCYKIIFGEGRVCCEPPKRTIRLGPFELLAIRFAG